MIIGTDFKIIESLINVKLSVAENLIITVLS